MSKLCGPFFKKRLNDDTLSSVIKERYLSKT